MFMRSLALLLAFLLATTPALAVEVKSGASTDLLTIDPTSKAARVTIYDTAGNYRGTKRTYTAATAAVGVAAASAVPFLFICGSASTTVIVRRVVISGMTLTAVQYASLDFRKYSSAPTGGTKTDLVKVPHDSADAGGTASIVGFYTAAPTAGSLVGLVGNRRKLLQATTAAAAGIPEEVTMTWEFDDSTKGVYLRGTAECLGVGFTAAPASAVSLGAEVLWTEE